MNLNVKVKEKERKIEDLKAQKAAVSFPQKRRKPEVFSKFLKITKRHIKVKLKK